MSAKLIQTTLNVQDQTVAMTVRLDVQGAPHLLSCVATSDALLARATVDGRTDWNTDDCVAEASAVIGRAVTK